MVTNILFQFSIKTIVKKRLLTIFDFAFIVYIRDKAYTTMNTQIIEEALTAALSLLINEIDSIEYEELREEYQLAIDKLELAINELKTK